VGREVRMARLEEVRAEDNRSPVPSSIEMIECSTKSVQRAGKQDRKSKSK